MESKVLKKVWITKYALTQGVFTAENVELCLDTVPDGSMISFKTQNDPSGFGYVQMYHKPDWHESREAAKARAEAMRMAKIKTLRKQLDKISTMAIVVPE
jgi:hypothetical protein